MVKIIPWLGAIALAFVAGYALSGHLASREMTLYVSVPGEYSVYAPGGNTIHAFTITGNFERKVDCEYLENRDEYDALVTYDVLLERASVAPDCYTAFMPR